MKRTILLADDSPTIQRLVTQIFADPEFRIVSVSNGDAALRKFDEIQPDVVLADIYMPGKNGYEVCAYVKGRSGDRPTPVVLLVGAFDAFDETTASRAGAAAHITKPFEPQALLNLVASLMPAGEKSRARQSGQDAESEVAAAQVAASAAGAPAVTQVEEKAVAAAGVAPVAEDTDLLGLDDLFKPPAAEPPSPRPVSEAEIDRIAERVLQKLSAQVIENVAWDVVPDITSKVLRDELKRNS